MGNHLLCLFAGMNDNVCSTSPCFAHQRDLTLIKLIQHSPSPFVSSYCLIDFSFACRKPIQESQVLLKDLLILFYLLPYLFIYLVFKTPVKSN